VGQFTPIPLSFVAALMISERLQDLCMVKARIQLFLDDLDDDEQEVDEDEWMEILVR
jgi:hypothetical protein